MHEGVCHVSKHFGNRAIVEMATASLGDIRVTFVVAEIDFESHHEYRPRGRREGVKTDLLEQNVEGLARPHPTRTVDHHAR